MKVFIVDDDRDFAEGLAAVLEMAGHEVELAFDGRQSIKMANERDFDVAFMDVMMPGMNGVETFQEIRKIKPSAKVVMMTGYAVQELLTEAVDDGALGVLQKPLAIEILLAKLEEIKPEGMVLIADDDPFFCESVRAILKKQGYEVCIAGTGREALERVLAGGIDVMALDLQMPELSGLEVYLELKRLGRSLPTIIVTGHSMEELDALDMLRDMSVTGVLTKPFDPVLLLKALKDRSLQPAPAPADDDDIWRGFPAG
ncbi:MAG: response regulator [Alphaproteobacteria bacterium]